MNRKAALLVLVLFIGAGVGGWLFLSKSKKGISGLKVVSNPPASVFLDDQLIGKTPYENKYVPGEYVLKLIPDETGSSASSWTGKIKLEPSFLTFVARDLGPSETMSGGESVTLEPLSGNEAQIAVFSQPDAVSITLDWQEKGISPIVLRDVLPGEHDVAASAPGFSSRTVRVQATSGYKVAVNFYLALVKDQEASTGSVPTGEVTTEAPRAEGMTPPYVVIKDTPTGFLRVRTEASTAATEVTQIKPDETFPLLEEKEGWYKIRYAEGKEGWISGRYADKIDK